MGWLWLWKLGRNDSGFSVSAAIDYGRLLRRAGSDMYTVGGLPSSFLDSASVLYERGGEPCKDLLNLAFVSEGESWMPQGVGLGIYVGLILCMQHKGFVI